MPKMTDRELIRRALLDALSWQSGLADANGADTGAGKIALERAALYRALIERKYGGIPTDAVRERRINLAALRAGIARIDI
jgi:hypothetical protein